MAYGDLLRALAEEVEREARSVREAAGREAEHLVEESRRAGAEERERALASRQRDEAAALARARAKAARDVEAVVLAESCRLLGGVRSAALAELKRRSAALVPRLVDELAALASAGPVTLVVDAADEPTVRDHHARHQPALQARATIRVAETARGGVDLEQDGIVLDDTLSARLERAWPALETRVAALILGEGDAV